MFEASPARHDFKLLSSQVIFALRRCGSTTEASDGPIFGQKGTQPESSGSKMKANTKPGA
jgi:hypothetical protein